MIRLNRVWTIAVPSHKSAMRYGDSGSREERLEIAVSRALGVTAKLWRNSTGYFGSRKLLCSGTPEHEFMICLAHSQQGSVNEFTELPERIRRWLEKGEGEEVCVFDLATRSVLPPDGIELARLVNNCQFFSGPALEEWARRNGAKLDSETMRTLDGFRSSSQSLFE